MNDQAKKLKIAFATDDGTTISSHFGRAQFYQIVSVENGRVAHQERREKSFHSGPHDHGQSAHNDAGRHDSMLEPVRDCQIVVARGMGAGMYQHIMDANLTPILTDRKTIEEAAREVIDGTIVNHAERVHRH